MSTCLLTLAYLDILSVMREVKGGVLGIGNLLQSWWVNLHWEKISGFSTVLYNLLTLKIKVISKNGLIQE